jgi:hypothetical protein
MASAMGARGMVDGGLDVEGQAIHGVNPSISLSQRGLHISAYATSKIPVSNSSKYLVRSCTGRINEY